MQVLDDELRLEAEEAAVMGDGLAIDAEGRVVVQVADVVAQEGMGAATHGERRLELPAKGERRAKARHRQAHGPRRVAPRAAHGQLDARDDPGHRVITSKVDRPVVRQEDVGDARQLLERVGVLVGDRLVGAVAAGHHQGAALEPAEQQMMQGRVREHQPRARDRRVRRRRIDASAGSPPEQHDRPRRRREQVRLRGGDHGNARAPVEVADHDRERLLVAVLAARRSRTAPA